MSYALQEFDGSTEEVARDLNSDFQFVADRLPTEIKEAAAGTTMTLCEIAGLGRLAATYMGQRRTPDGPAQFEFVVRLSVLGEGYEGRLGLHKEFGLTYATLHQEGPLRDLEPVRPEQLEGCPAPLGVLAFTVQSLRSEFARQHGGEYGPTADIAYLDTFRG